MILSSFAQYLATFCFALAILHTFSVKRLQHWAARYPEGSVAENFLHLIGEVEVVFGVWSAVFLMILVFSDGSQTALAYLNQCNFTEPAFVFAILVTCSTRPILELAFQALQFFSRLIPIQKSIAFYWVTLTLGPLLGSIITEPAAMTVTALILLERYFRAEHFSRRLKYATLGLLFVNVSIGGTLTPYAAPPILMVAPIWGWDLMHMLTQFGWKGALAVITSTTAVTLFFRKELAKISIESSDPVRAKTKIPLWVGGTHLLFLGVIIASSHHLVVFGGVFLFLLGLITVTREYQAELKLKEGLLVAFFLGGLVVLGKPQSWWLADVLSRLDSVTLFLGATGLTAFVDNAALTFLGAQVPHLSEASKYALVAGSVVGGGLTVIANAPNPAGFGILNPTFGPEGISPAGLLLAAIPPTVVAAICFNL